MHRSVRCALIAQTVLFAVGAAAQVATVPSFVQPAEVLMAVGQSQPFQLLDHEGQEIPSTDWTISDTEVAELKVHSGRATVTAKAAGHAVVTTGTWQAEIEIIENGLSIGLAQPRWVLHPVDGQFANVVWAWQTWAGSAEDVDGEVDLHFPAYYYEDRGATASHIRGIRSDGLQAWQWPAGPSIDKPRLICGDMYGGVLLAVGDPQARVLINIDARGRERWRAPAPGFGSAHAYNLSGRFYFVQDDAERTSARIIGLNARTGQQNTSFELPASHETLRNMVVRDGTPTCTPGSESVKRLPISHTVMMTGPNGNSYLMYSEASVVADAGRCATGTSLDLRHIHIVSTQRMVAVDILPDDGVTTQMVEENKGEGPAATTPVIATLPTGDIIPGDGDTGAGNFVAVRRVTTFWGNKNPLKVDEFEYRISGNRQVLYRFQVPSSSSGVRSITLLGDGRIGFTSRGKTVIAFDQDTGHQKWRWEGKSASVVPHAALKDGAVIVRDGEHYVILKDGVPIGQRDEPFMLFVTRFRIPDDED